MIKRMHRHEMQTISVAKRVKSGDENQEIQDIQGVLVGRQTPRDVEQYCTETTGAGMGKCATAQANAEIPPGRSQHRSSP